MKKDKGIRTVLIALFGAMLVIGIFYRLSNKPIVSEEEDVKKATAVDIALMRNLLIDYPQTPKEVVKYFSEITQCYYNEPFEEDDERLEALAKQMLLLYDDELANAKPFSDYMFDLKSDINFYNTNGYKISSFSPSASTDVEYYSESGYECAKLYCVYTIKSGKYYDHLNEVFVLRKDENSHWRILGWEEVDG